MAGKGGKRPGAGRKSNATRLLEAGFACAYFDALEQEKLWKSMLSSEDEKIRLDAGKYLTDRLYGKPAQAVDMNMSGELNVTNLTEEELAEKLSAFGIAHSPAEA